MWARRIAAGPLILLGGIAWVVALAGTVGVGLYFSYLGIKQAIDGDIAQGLGTFFVTATAAGFIGSLLGSAGSLVLAGGIALWGGTQPPPPATEEDFNYFG